MSVFLGRHTKEHQLQLWAKPYIASPLSGEVTLKVLQALQYDAETLDCVQSSFKLTLIDPRCRIKIRSFREAENTRGIARSVSTLSFKNQERICPRGLYYVPDSSLRKDISDFNLLSSSHRYRTTRNDCGDIEE